MTKLALTTEKLQTFQIQTKPDTNPKGKGFALSLNQNEADISYKLEKLRLQIIDGEVSNVHYKRLGTKIRESKRLTWIIILAMLDKKHSNIVKMLAEKDMNIDAPIFKLKHMPTLYYLACMLKCDRLMKYGDHKKYWLGIPASVLSGNIGIGDVQSVMSVTQFKYFNELIKVYQMIRKKEVNPFFEIYEQHKKILQSTHEVPVLYSDLYCAYNDHDAISRFLPRYYNMIKNSKMVYLLQCNTNIVLHLQSYSITPYNFYCNLSPLHVAAYYGNLEVLAMYVELAFNPNKQDFNGNTPMHFAAMMGHKLCYDFMCHKIYLDTCRFSFNKGDEYKTNKKGQQPKELLKSNTKSKGNYDLIRTINNLKKARTAAESFKETKFRLISFDTIFNGENNSALKKHIQKLQTILVDDHDFDMSSKHCYEMFCKIVMDK